MTKKKTKKAKQLVKLGPVGMERRATMPFRRRVTISKTFDFDAAHWLTGVPRGHKCRRLHGHTYRVEVVLSGFTDKRGMVADYAEIAEAWKPVHELLDHRCLNHVEGLENPTTEVLAPLILDMLVDALPLLERVRVYESATTWCEVWR
jgi:6-pyruvoyltetrahydropterin/6-carboxytetrahydropterin synthase